jgi:hypothetical protein
MSANMLRQRIEALESRSHTKEELVPFEAQWLHEDGTPAGPVIKRMVPKGMVE